MPLDASWIDGWCDAIPAAIVAIDPETGRISKWNAAATELFGYSRHEVVGEPLSSVLPELAAAVHGPDATYRVGATDKSGSGLWVEAALRHAPIGEGQPLRMAVLRPLAEQAADWAMHEAQEALLEQSADAVMIIDLSDPDHDRMIYWNRGAERLYGWPVEEVLGKSYLTFLPTEFPEPIEAINEKFIATGNWQGELVQTHRDGTRLVIESRWTLQRDAEGRPWRVLGINTDITARRQAEEATRLAKEQLEFVLEASPVLTYMLELRDGQMTPKWQTENTQRILGYTVEEALDPQWWINNAHPEDVEAIFRDRKEPAAGDTLSAEYRFRHKDGHELWLRGENRVLQGTECLYIVGTLLDITERKRVDDLLAESQRIAQLGSWEWEVDTGKVHWSDEMYRIMGLSPDVESTYALYLSAVHPDDRERLEQRLKQAFDGSVPFALVHRIIRPDGSLRHIQARGKIIPASAGRSLRMVGTGQDVTERQHILTELELAKVHAEQASQAKSMFLANMSHELRTPLNAIIGYSEMLQEEAEDLACETFVPDLRKIHTAGRHLLGLINDILDLSKIEAGKVELFLEACDMAELAHEVASTVENLVEQGGNTLEVQLASDLPDLRLDVTKVRQCLINLLSNACKFTRDGSITLEVAPLVIDGDAGIRLSVSDTGIGMSQEQLGRIFDEFTQADASTTRQYGGTGLGLTITSRLLQLMGGELSVSSVPGRGSTFTITLPAGRLPQEPGPAEEVVAVDRQLVLVIDDDPSVHDILERFLARQGYGVLKAGDGEAGLRLARERSPAAIVLDVKLPDTDGWAVLAALKTDPALTETPVIMLTMVDEPRKGLDLGVADYLVKPLDRARLAAALRTHINKEGATRSIDHLPPRRTETP